MNDYTISGCSIVTLDPKMPFIQKGRIAVADDTITSIEPVDGPVTKAREEYSRCVILPGFVNAHTHLFLSMWRSLEDDMQLFPWLELLSPFIGQMKSDDFRYSNYLGVMEAVLSGTTTLCECCRYDPTITAQIASEMGVRSISGGMPASEWFGKPLPTDLPGLVEKTSRIIETQSPSNLARAFIGVHSPYNCSPDFIVEVKKIADELGTPFNIHVAETTAEMEIIRQRYGKSPVQYLNDLGVLGPNTIADHSVWLDEADMQLFKASGAGVVHCPISNAKLGSGIAPINRYHELGIPVAIGTDSVVSNNSLNMIEEMKFGLLLQRVSGNSRMAPQLNALDVLEMATIGGARVLGMDQMIGSIEIGKKADFVVVELPPEMPITYEKVVSHLVYSASPEDIKLVVVNGKKVVKERQLQFIDGNSLRSQISNYFDYRFREISNH